ncbi:undecaprenyldiphospho-muramoylpentapeptide beta-N-acetylglucosaminyltransferase [Maribellus sp. YY47]|uniref:undecaprenyldiphospho-muramoylpentapeptide beta-N-acetylglucosaminyltransferase n=1 Tax=Maribellus sp. YY47 TaxID=2929486 RepID=UPI00200127F7|nr:undecaprenyldiphospho-muramoylpentapeptide beta-N-acetylglucosaminyltransferase [Maribellus sp. YY47]MCK3685882.1 undecaprenyldiphospho-muramoylpentapeptide beta-N-acetylglucosaminyltransferase [Maribellus sp. YY47]
MKKKINRVILSGGGTGGHIFPALAIANEIRRRNPDAEILFVGALGRMEMEKVPAAGYKIIGLPVMGFPRKPSLKMITFFRKLMQSASMARKIVKDFKPEVAIGVGGYASGPLLRAAAKFKVPTLIQEQNSYAGITNKLLSKKVKSICVAYDKMERFFPKEKIVFTGNPVRENLIQKIDKQEALNYFGLNETDKVILIVGGSLGARSINNAVLKNIKSIADTDIKVVWQTGAIYYDRIEEELKTSKPGNLQVHKFISRMDLAYAVADLVISRAGAGTISELCLVEKASVLVPSPNVAEDHQTKNALALVEKEAALMLRDDEIDIRLFPLAFEVVNNAEKCSRLSEKIKGLARPEATKTIVDEVEKLLK